MRISDWSSDVCSSDLDWIEHGTFDGAPGDNFDEIFAQDGVVGHDVFFGLGGFDEFIAEGGDDIMVGSPGRGKMAGRSEEHTSELQSLMRISYAVFCLKKKINQT